mmetsp:Transcript_112931/g.314252  ORF Transcript_112931/g.314252 Transcript_112931/m.314252 type:complete len:331 (-) Transcript_112931:187-1179(-)
MRAEPLQARHKVLAHGCWRRSALEAQPGHHQDLLGCWTQGRVCGEHQGDDVFGALGYVVPLRRAKLKGALADAAKDYGVGVPGEGRVATEEDEGDDTGAPNVAPLVILALEHFGREVVGCARFCRHRLSRLKVASEAKVNNFQSGVRRRILKQKILRLRIAVCKPVRMEIAKCTEDLPNKFRSLHLIKATRHIHNPVPKLATSTKLHDEINFACVAKSLEQPHHIRMVELLCYCNFPLKPGWIPHPLDLDALHATLRSCLHVLCPEATAIGAFAELRAGDLVELLELPRIVAGKSVLEAKAPLALACQCRLLTVTVGGCRRLHHDLCWHA